MVFLFYALRLDQLWEFLQVPLIFIFRVQFFNSVILHDVCKVQQKLANFFIFLLSFTLISSFFSLLSSSSPSCFPPLLPHVFLLFSLILSSSSPSFFPPLLHILSSSFPLHSTLSHGSIIIFLNLKVAG